MELNVYEKVQVINVSRRKETEEGEGEGEEVKDP
jgi:hypothetical protein